MLPDVVINTLLFLSIGLMAIMSLVVSIRALATRRPIVTSARLFWVFTAALGSIYVKQIQSLLSPNSSGGEFFAVIMIVSFGLFIVVCWQVRQTYLVLGVTEAAFKHALLASLDELGMEYKESLAGFALDELNDELQVGFRGWVATADFKMKTGANREHLQQVVTVLRRQLAAAPGRANLIISVTYGVMALLFLSVAGVYIALEF